MQYSLAVYINLYGIQGEMTKLHHKYFFIIQAHAWEVRVNIFQVEIHFFRKLHIKRYIIHALIFQEITCKGPHFSGQGPFFQKITFKVCIIEVQIFQEIACKGQHFSDQGPLFSKITYIGPYFSS